VFEREKFKKTPDVGPFDVDHDVTFLDGLQFLDKETRELVGVIVEERVSMKLAQGNDKYIRELEYKIYRKQEDYNRLLKDYKIQEENFEKEKDTNAELEDKIEEQDGIVCRLQSEIGTLYERMELLTERNEELDGRIEYEEARAEKGKVTQLALEDKVEKLGKELDLSNNEKKNLGETVRTLEDKIKKMKIGIREMERKLVGIEKELAEARERIRTLDEKNATQCILLAHVSRQDALRCVLLIKRSYSFSCLGQFLFNAH
jgi:chromosome segregation ATPase